jgi:hypothetical protein
MAISTSARLFRSGASRSACFSRGPKGLIMHKALTSASFGASSIPFQSTFTSAASTKLRSALRTPARSTSSSPARAVKSAENGSKSTWHWR